MPTEDGEPERQWLDMGYICSRDDPLWDPGQTWTSDDPNLSPCFRKTFSIYVPLAMLGLGMIISVILAKVSWRLPAEKILVSKKFLAHIVFHLCLLIFCSMYIVYLVFSDRVSTWSEMLYEFLVVLLLLLSLSLLYTQRTWGKSSSALHFYVFLVAFLLSLPGFKSGIKVREIVTTVNSTQF